MKKILILSSSFRKNSNSARLAREFERGAKESGNETEFISLAGKSIGFCTGCLSCQKTHRCFMRDDADAIEQKMRESDVLVFSTPIYYYEMSGQLKTMLDRANPIFVSDYRFRDVYFLSTAADEDPASPLRALSGVQGWIECFEKARLAGSLFCGGVDGEGAIEGKPALKEAYEMGKHC